MADIERAIEIQSDYYWSYLSRELIYEELGETKKARVDFKRACENGEDEACDAVRGLGK